MGNLHQLRKAIEADPFAFYSGETGMPEPEDWAYGAVKTEKGWIPVSGLLCDRRSYRGFVRHVLIGLGYMMKERAARRMLEKKRRREERERLDAIKNPPLLFSSIKPMNPLQILSDARNLLQKEQRRSKT